MSKKYLAGGTGDFTRDALDVLGQTLYEEAAEIIDALLDRPTVLRRWMRDGEDRVISALARKSIKKKE